MAHAKGFPKATWLWNTEQIKTQANDIVSFTSANGVNQIYLQINIDIPVSYYKAFIRLAATKGITVDALNGAPSWALTSERNQITKFINWVEDYQSHSLASEQFHGLHMDIEPHLLPQWKTNLNSVIEQWQKSVIYLTQEAKRLNMPIAADIPFWLSNYKATNDNITLSRFMITAYDSITIMSYRDTAAAIYSVAERELEEARFLGKPAFAAVETKSSNEGNFITFYEEGAKYMNEQLNLLSGLAKAQDAFAGVAIHDYDGWRAFSGR
ncbi:hypothetical protein JCM16418_1233 [Paenibacillus pini JCM 16418]|uniref:Uncharacterized protein n=2 Tax=Paenibacillus TaxID=44249 RepID=W7YXU4_9BACL|nr:hypothetical protein JCM16418_1233 [Paenibacillus pini JCM 16418]